MVEDPTLKPKVTTYKIDFYVEGKLVYALSYTDDGAPFKEPVVPHVPGKTGAWETYSLEAGGDLVVNAIYTDAQTEPEVSWVETEPLPDTESDTTESAPETTAPEQSEGCGATLAALPLLILIIPAIVCSKKKEVAQ